MFALTRRHAETLAESFDAHFADLKPHPTVRRADFVLRDGGDVPAPDADAIVTHVRDSFPDCHAASGRHDFSRSHDASDQCMRTRTPAASLPRTTPSAPVRARCRHTTEVAARVTAELDGVHGLMRR